VLVNLGRDHTGKRRRKSSYAPTQAAAVDQLKKLAGRAADGHLLSTSTPTVASFLEEWYVLHCDEWRPSTCRSYRAAIDGFLVPAFGRLRLEHLSAQHVQKWLVQHKAAHGARRRVTLAHATLRSALAHAKRVGIVGINAATNVKVPKPTVRPIAPLDVEQARAFLTVSDPHRLGALFSVALACGLRLGEATGLRWLNVDLATGEIRVHEQLQRVGKKLVLQPVKTAKSRRTLMMPQVCLDALRAHRTRQLEDRLKAGPQWVESGLVFTTFLRREGHTVGGPLDPRNVLRTLHTLLASANLPRMRFHDLRHSAASLLIAAGVELVEVSMLLGHSELRTTADLYAHLQKQTAARAAGRMDAMLRPVSKA
jgi:integrase